MYVFMWKKGAKYVEKYVEIFIFYENIGKESRVNILILVKFYSLKLAKN